MIELVAADIGGTHARFALAEVEDGKVQVLGEACTFLTAEHVTLQAAWQAFARTISRPMPRAAALALACPVDGEVLKLTNSPWIIRPSEILETLAVDQFTLVNDFGAVAHSVAQLDAGQFTRLFGPETPLSAAQVITVIGPGTGLGAAQFLRRVEAGAVIETEAGHADFSPLDPLEDAILAFLRTRFRRVSVERIVSGPGLANIYEALAAVEGRAVQIDDDKALWADAVAGTDSRAVAALDRFCLSFGAVTGDIALINGADAVVLAGGLTTRLDETLRKSGFHRRFVAKGRLEQAMADLPVFRLTYPEPGLFGAAAAFAAEHAR